MKQEKKKRNKRIWYTNKSTVIVFIVLRVLIALTAVLSILRRDYESAFIAIFTFFLLLLPSILSKGLHITLPSTLEIILLCFIFAANTWVRLITSMSTFPIGTRCCTP